MDEPSKKLLAVRIFSPVIGLDAIFVTYGQLAGPQFSSHLLALFSFIVGVIAFAGVIVVGKKIAEENVEGFVIGMVVLLGASIAVLPLHLDLKWVDGSGIVNPPIILLVVFFLSLAINMIIVKSTQTVIPMGGHQPPDFKPTDDLTHFELTDDPAISYDGWVAKQQLDKDAE